jgi:hypothetical protein
MADEIEGRRLALAAAAEGQLARFDAAETALRRRCRALAWDGTGDGTEDGTGGGPE